MVKCAFDNPVSVCGYSRSLGLLTISIRYLCAERPMP